VAAIRTVLVTTPVLLHDLIERLAIGRVEIDIVAQLDGRRALAERLAPLRPQLIVIGLRENETERLIHGLLMQLPQARVITLSHDGRSMVGYDLQMHRTALSGRSVQDVFDFIDPASGKFGSKS
jgi:hypothetical protein